MPKLGSFRVSYVADRELHRLADVDRRVFADSANWFSAAAGAGWLRRYRNGILLLEDQQRRPAGYAKCLPLRERTYLTMIRGHSDVRDLLVPANILTEPVARRNALDASGNYCYVGMVVSEPESRGEQYGEAAGLLLQELEVLFHSLHVRGLVCQSETDAEVEPIVWAGCEKAGTLGRTADGERQVWYFDLGLARARPTSGLGVVFHNLWSMRPLETALRLTPAQRRVLRLTADGFSDDSVAKILGIATSTVRKHWDNARERFRAHMKRPRATRESVIAYCHKHPLELVVPSPELE